MEQRPELRVLPDEDISAINAYLSIPEGSSSSSTLTLAPLEFLSAHLDVLPTSLLTPFARVTTPKQRTLIPVIKRRRYLYAQPADGSSPPPPLLQADRGRLRWPLLWSRLGGARLPPPSADVREEEDWVRDSFLSGSDGTQHVKKLGGFLRDLEEEREWEEMGRAKREERKLDDVGEEFEEESDEEEEDPGEAEQDRSVQTVSNGHNAPGQAAPVEAEDQDEVRRIFERRLLELFLDGLDTIDYNPIDFAEPPDGDPIGVREAEDRYFDDESPSTTPSAEQAALSPPPPPFSLVTIPGATVTRRRDGFRLASDGETAQNGQGEYDY